MIFPNNSDTTLTLVKLNVDYKLLVISSPFDIAGTRETSDSLNITTAYPPLRYNLTFCE